MTLNEMKLHASFSECVVPPTIEGFFAVDGGLRISPNSLKMMVARDGVEPPTPAFSEPWF
jgi:hypothetical protein